MIEYLPPGCATMREGEFPTAEVPSPFHPQVRLHESFRLLGLPPVCIAGALEEDADRCSAVTPLDTAGGGLALLEDITL